MLLLHCCAFYKFYMQIFNTRLIRLRVIEGPNIHDQIVFCAFHSFLVEVQINDCYLHATQDNNNLEFRIALQAPLVTLFSISFGTYNRPQEKLITMLMQNVGAWWTTKSIMVFLEKGLFK